MSIFRFMKELLANVKAIRLLTQELLRLVRKLEPEASTHLSLQFTERKEKPMPLTPQAFSVHPDKLVDIVATLPADAKNADGTPATLTSLTFTPTPSNVGFLDTSDPEAGPSHDVLNTEGVSVGATDSLTFVGQASNGKEYDALGVGTVIAPDQPAEELALTFTERVA